MKNFFNKLLGRQKSLKPSNRLEELLDKTAGDLSLLPELYRQMFHYKFFVLGKPSELGSVQFMSNDVEGEKCVYAFTSSEALKFGTGGSGSVPFIEMMAADFLPILVESRLGFLLNANTNIGKHFKASEVMAILSGGGSQERVVPAGSKINLSIPDKIPLPLIAALRGHIQKTAGLEDIYFGLHEVNQKSSYILALKIAPNSNASVQEIVKDLSVIIKEVGSDRAIDMAAADKMFVTAFERGGLLSCLNFS